MPVLTSAALFTNAGPDIKGHVTEVSGKLVLACNMTAPHPAIGGHEWLRGDKVLQTDADSSAFTTYT